MRTTARTRIAAVLLAGVTGLALTACSSDSDSSTDAGASSPAMESPAMESPSMAPSDDATTGMMDPASDLVGAGCADYAAAVPDGPGSVTGMSTDPVAVAASNNPLLTTLTAAVSGKLNPDVNLVDTLNGSEFTVFAPVDDAFKKIDAATIDGLKTDSDTLTKILTYHVVPGQISPDKIDGEHKTVEGGTVKVTGSGDDIMVNGAKVICGGVHTANATVYLIDSVLMPTM
ncbi:fasciclin domain-containing protein [Cellulomonas sp. PhB150]|uniref:fasciclin domain-containing protein n=1 Tax=Cellulomonas sp. PhB150 TaxID=2485188 RepID=UPI000F4AE178|nr:fasciclin domain-containing protein [Cellulomonas sp. PhB150]ROS31302.1 putative surface protein with fasciclin (FAS1) repeats [Cellulomonas sp. PhB150]